MTKKSSFSNENYLSISKKMIARVKKGIYSLMTRPFIPPPTPLKDPAIKRRPFLAASQMETKKISSGRVSK